MSPEASTMLPCNSASPTPTGSGTLARLKADLLATAKDAGRLGRLSEEQATLGSGWVDRFAKPANDIQNALGVAASQHGVAPGTVEPPAPRPGSGPVPSALNSDGSGSDAFVTPPGKPAPVAAAQESEPDASDLSRWTNIRPRTDSD
jgi:hypothetical protein